MRTRAYSLVLLLAFAVGVILLPAWHRAHSGKTLSALAVGATLPTGNQHGIPAPAHDPDCCPSCLIAAGGLIQPVAMPLQPLVTAPCVAVSYPVRSPVGSPARRLPVSCGPPPGG